VVTSFFDGYNSYLLVVDESTKFTWVYLCESKEPPIQLVNLHFDQFGGKSGFIRTDQGGELVAQTTSSSKWLKGPSLWNLRMQIAPIKTSKQRNTTTFSELLLEYYSMVPVCLLIFGQLCYYMPHTFTIAESTSLH
jgi:hypothetical protein